MLRRAAFSARLSDFTAYTNCLRAEDWQPQREAFLKSIDEYFTTPRYYFELASYFPRIVALGAAGVRDASSREIVILKSIFKKIAADIEVVSRVKETSMAAKSISSFGDAFDVGGKLREGVVSAFTEAIATAVRDESLRQRLLLELKDAFGNLQRQVTLLPDYDAFLLADLAQEPYTRVLSTVYDFQKTKIGYDRHAIVGLDKILGATVKDTVHDLLSRRGEWEQIRDAFAFGGLVFPTRPLKPNDLYALLPSPYDKQGKSRAIILKWMELLSYGKKDEEFLFFERTGQKPLLIKVPRGSANARKKVSSSVSKESNPRIALAYWHVSDQLYACQLSGNFSTSDRAMTFSCLMRLLERIHKSDRQIDYIVFPELAMPWRWFLYAAMKLKTVGVSLISGVEYLSQGEREVSNEVWCSLCYSGLGFPDSVLIRVVKTAPSNHEEECLCAYGLKFQSSIPEKTFQAGDVVQHGADSSSLFFSILVCSDLTDVSLRARLRGQIDLLFVPAWNTDLETFEDIVNSSAFDLNAYIALCNNGTLGDTRIRAPYKTNYKRDVLRLKGGEDDYFVIGSVDVMALRRSQAGVYEPKDPLFKPTPIGFKMSVERRNATIKKVCEKSAYKFVRVLDGAFEILWSDPQTQEPLDVGLKVGFDKLRSNKQIIEYVRKTLLPCQYFPKEGIGEFIKACNSRLGSNLRLEMSEGFIGLFADQ